MNTNADTPDRHAVYGHPPLALADHAPEDLQLSPLSPDSTPLEDVAPGSLTRLVMQAPGGTVERRYAVALGLRALAPLGSLTVLAPKDKGGSRIRKELEAFGCTVVETSKQHHRICTCTPPPTPTGLEAAIAAGAPRRVEALGLWSQPGLFGWDRIDPGSALLAKHLPAFKGDGADLGCGIGYLALQVLKSAKVDRLFLIDNDRRAIQAVTRNVDEPRARALWIDLRSTPAAEPGALDFVVTNPPFHDAGREDQALGADFIRAASRALRRGGALWIVANRHLPYEAVLREGFARVTLKAEAAGFKVYEAIR